MLPVIEITIFDGLTKFIYTEIKKFLKYRILKSYYKNYSNLRLNYYILNNNKKIGIKQRRNYKNKNTQIFLRSRKPSYETYKFNVISYDLYNKHNKK